MKRKRLLKKIARLEAEVTKLRLPPPLTFDNLEIYWPKRTVKYRGKTIVAEDGYDWLVLPMTNDMNVLVPASGYRYLPLEMP